MFIRIKFNTGVFIGVVMLVKLNMSTFQEYILSGLG